MSDNKVENVIIIGGGPAGLAAAVYTSRATFEPLMFAGAPYGGQLMLTSEVENYPGIDSILGPELIERMRMQVRAFKTKILDQNVLKVDFSKRPFVVTADKDYFAKTVIIATGAKALWLGLESEQRLRGKGVSACATCDGFFFKGKVVGVVGGGDSAMEEALFLTRFASKVHIFHRRDSFRASKIMQERVLNHKNVEVHWNTEVTEVLGDKHVEGVRLTQVGLNGEGLRGSHRQRVTENGTKTSQTQPSTDTSSDTDNHSSDVFKLDGLFIAIGHKPDTDLFKGHVELDEKGYILTNTTAALAGKKLQANGPKLQTGTSVAGVFAAGDNVDHVYRQAGTASGMGIAAAIDAERWLEEEA